MDRSKTTRSPEPDVQLPKLGKLKIGEYPIDLDYFLTTDYQDTHSAGRELPAVIEYVNQQLQIATEQKLITKSQIKQAEAQAYFDLRNGLFEQRGYQGKATEVSLEHAIHLEDPVKKVHEDYAVWAAQSLRLSNLIISLQAKLDLVRSSEATRRAMIDDGDKSID